MMPSNLQPSKKHLDSAASMNLESRHISRQQQNSAVKERVLSCQEHQKLKHQGKLNAKGSVCPPCTELPRELRQEADSKFLVQTKFSGTSKLPYLKKIDKKDDELVKYMSKLPGYLKHVEGGKNIQDKALNLGVLDWARLEEWKYNKKCAIASGSNDVSASGNSLLLRTTVKPSTFSSSTQGGTHAHQSEQHPSLCPSLNSAKKNDLSRGVKPSSQKALHFQDFEMSSRSNLGGQRKISWNNKLFDRNDAAAARRKGKSKDCDQKIASKMRKLSTDLGKDGVAPSPKEKVNSWDGKVEKRVEEAQVSNRNNKALDNIAFSNMRTSYPKLRSNGICPDSKEEICVGNVETSKRTDKSKESTIDYMPCELKDIVLPSSKEFSPNSSPKDENLIEADQKCFSGGSFSLVKSCSAELGDDIPHSCPLPYEVESKIKPNLIPHSLTKSQCVELSSGPSHQSPYSSASSATLYDDEDAERKPPNHMNGNADENLNLMDLEMDEMAVTRSGKPSPSHRFSFGISRIGRSFSWKESSGVPRLISSYVSVKSGPVKSEEASCLDDSSRQNTNGHNRARSSPLRRILDPLLRSRSSKREHAAEAFPPSKGNLSYLNFKPIVASASLSNEKHGASTTKALLQLTMKNGHPLFKIVVDYNSSVLAATVNNLESEKEDSGQNYTFYSVNEIKKKGGGWLSQGSKPKSCGFVYNIIGQMVSRSHFPNPKCQNIENQYMVREAVLFGVEPKQVDQESTKLPNKELAAIVVKIPIEGLSHDAEQRESTTDRAFSVSFAQDRCSFYLGENDNSCSTTVILPDGVHGLPDKGAPSSLIQRWKSGGLCDCGGWDVGCKLRTLANRSQMTSIACSNSNTFELFEGGAQQNRPIFSLVPLNKEIYSVEFNSSVSLLQAFFISVTVLSSQISSDLSEVGNLYEADDFSEEPKMSEKGTKKSSLTHVVLGKMPAKYAPNPPHSPAGRV